MRNAHHRSSNAAGVSILICALLASGVIAVDARDDGDLDPTLLRRVVEQTTRTGITIRATRELSAGTLSGKHQGWMTVETQVVPASGLSWRVVSESGSDRTRDKVFRSILRSEAESWHDGSRTEAALTPDNYIFTLLSSSSGGEIQIRLEPRRRDSRLVDGVLTVSADGYPVRLEGTLAKSPSFWVKSVTIRKRYGRFAGVALPTLFESDADLKFVGRSRFTMRYHYQEVNGRRIPASNAIADNTP